MTGVFLISESFHPMDNVDCSAGLHLANPLRILQSLTQF